MGGVDWGYKNHQGIKQSSGGCIPKMKIATLAESDEVRVPPPCECCTPRMKMAILVESGELGAPHPCECCAPRMEITILVESDESQF